MSHIYIAISGGMVAILMVAVFVFVAELLGGKYRKNTLSRQFDLILTHMLKFKFSISALFVFTFFAFLIL